jgi:hypothetical protein
VGQECRPWTRPMQAAPEQVSGGAHFSRIAIGWGPPAAAQQHGDLLGGNLRVLGLAPMARRQVQGVSQDTGHALRGAQVGEPGPR